MIAIDIRFLSENMKDGIISSGVGVFFKEIIEGIRNNKISKEFALIVDDKALKSAKELFPDFNIFLLNFSISDNNKIYLLPFHHLIDGYRLKKLLIANNVSCIWFPMASPFWFMHTGIRTVSTLHDIIPFHENPQSISWRLGVKHILKNSEKVITDSEYVKNDIVKTFELSDKYLNKIFKIPCSVIYDNNAKDFSPVLRDRKFILDVNAYQDRKNGFTLLNAFKKIYKDIDYDLVFCGGYNENNTLEKMKSYSEQIGLSERVHFFLAIPIENRNWLMKNADLFVSPSLSEGFGRSPIEAAMYKTPVLTTKSDSLVEVTFGLTSYYDNPTDSDELANRILKILSLPPSGIELDRIAEKMISEYSPDHISLKYYNALTE